MGIVVLVNGVMILFLALLMATDALVFRGTADVFGPLALATGATGSFLILATRRTGMQFDRLHGFILTASVWLVAAFTGAVPLWYAGLSPADALFEAMSGITTTGSTVMSGLDTTPRGILFWRALLQLMGGVGFIVTAMALLPMLRVGGMQLYRTESSDKGERELQTVVGYALATLAIYLGLVLLASLTYWAGGMGGFDALTHAMTTLSTGGYSNYDASFGHFTQPFLHWAATFFMLAGALPFAWYIRIAIRRSLRSEQVAAFLKGVVATTLLLAF